MSGKPLTDRTAERHLLKLADLIFTLGAKQPPGVSEQGLCGIFMRRLHFTVDGHKQIYGRPSGS